MPIPGVSINIQDGALGQVASSAAGIPCFLGVSSQGTVNHLQTFSDVQVLVDTLGQGPLVEAAAYVLAQSGGPVRCVRAAGAGQGSFSDSQVSNPSAPMVTIGGTPYDRYSVVIRITRTGQQGEATYRYSLDGGATYSSEIVIPEGSSPVPLGNTGLTADFPWSDPQEPEVPGTYTAGDTYSVEASAPTYDLESLNEMIDAAIGSSAPWEMLYVVGSTVEEPEDLLAQIALLDAKLGAATQQHRYAFGIVEIPVGVGPETPAILSGILLTVASTRVMAVPAGATVTSAITGRPQSRSAALPVVQRLASIPISEDPGRVRSGPLPGVTSVQWDEARLGGLDEARCTTLRTHVGRQGYFVTNGRMLAPEGSDFDMVMRRRVMDRACAIAYDGLLDYVGESVRVDSETGHILESDAKAIEAFVGSKLDAALTDEGHVSSVRVEVRRNDNVLATNKLRASVRIVPLAYAKEIEAEISFENPAISQA